MTIDCGSSFVLYISSRLSGPVIAGHVRQEQSVWEPQVSIIIIIIIIIILLSKNLKIKIYRTIILTVVLYGCETWSLTLRE